MSRLNIGVFGDSYADNELVPRMKELTTDESWIRYIKDKGHRITSYALSGTASYHAFRKFKDHHAQYDHIVFCWSFAHRIQNMPQRYARLSSFKSVEQFYDTWAFKIYSTDEQAEIVKILLAYESLNDFTFNNWIQQKMFDDVNKICKEKNIKLVNIFPFVVRATGEVDFSDRHGDCLYRLFDVTNQELNINGFMDVRSTHLSKENNDILGQIVLDRFAEDKKLIMDLYKEGNFVYDKEITNRYVELGYAYTRLLGMDKK